MTSKAELERELETLKKEHQELTRKFQSIENGLIEQVVKATLKSLNTPKDPIQAEVLWRLRRTRREFVFKKINDSLTLNGTDLAELKYHIVDQNKYCSKATFYRYISQLSSDKRINLVNVGNKTLAIQKEIVSA